MTMSKFDNSIVVDDLDNWHSAGGGESGEFGTWNGILLNSYRGRGGPRGGVRSVLEIYGRDCPNLILTYCDDFYRRWCTWACACGSEMITITAISTIVIDFHAVQFSSDFRDSNSIWSGYFPHPPNCCS